MVAPEYPASPMTALRDLPETEFLEREELPRSKWPFFLGDAFLVATAIGIALSHHPLNPWQTLFCLLAVMAGALLAAWPWIQEYRIAHESRILEAEKARVSESRRANTAQAQFEAASRKLESALGDTKALHTRLDEQKRLCQTLQDRLRACEEGLTQVRQQTGPKLGELGEEVEGLADGLRDLSARLESLVNQVSTAGHHPGLVAGAESSSTAGPPGSPSSAGTDGPDGVREPAAGAASLLGKALGHAVPVGQSSALNKLLGKNPANGTSPVPPRSMGSQS